MPGRPRVGPPSPASPMPARLAALLTLALAASAPAVAQGLQIHAAVTPDAPGDTDGMRPMPTLATGDEVWVGDVLLDLADESVETVGLERDAGGATLSLWLSGEAGAAFADLTARSVGRALAVVREGRVLTAAVVQSEIPNGLVLITGLDGAEADRLAAALRGDGPERAAPPTIPTPTPLDLPERPPLQLDPPRGVDGQGDALAEGGATAQDVALGFSQYVAARRWRDAADALHPLALTVARTDALAVLDLDDGGVRMRDGDRSVQIDAGDVLGRRAPARLDDLADRDLAALYFAGLDALGMWGVPGAPRAILGTVSEGDRTHALMRIGDPGLGVSDVAVVTVAVYGEGAWGVLLTQAQGF